MGSEIQLTNSEFKKSDFEEFYHRLQGETDLLSQWFREDKFDSQSRKFGYELEGWLTYENFCPAPDITKFLTHVNHPDFVQELAKFNFEINGQPQAKGQQFLELFYKELQSHHQRCQASSKTLKIHPLFIGILPTVTPDDLTIENLSPRNRYFALTQQILKYRHGDPLKIDIQGKEQVQHLAPNIMIEAAATSLQIHHQVPLDQCVRHYNAAQICSMFTVAAAANSPILFGKTLWQETRIPLFEQAVSMAGYSDERGECTDNATFGEGYAQESLMEPFLHNLQKYTVLLPLRFEESPDQLKHLKLQNGTVWRWNRPIIGFNDDGTPHIRVEHRVLGSGPTLIDTVANIAFYLGLVHALAENPEAPESKIPFETTRDNFYLAAQYGLDAKVDWMEKKNIRLKDLILEMALPLAHQGLKSIGISDSERSRWLDEIMQKRISSEQTGAQWQQKFLAKHPQQLEKLVQTYYQHQESDQPVHQWPI